MTKAPKLLLDREVRLIERLGILDFELRHVAGAQNAADVLSRIPGTGLAPLHVWDLGSGCGSFLRGLQGLLVDPTGGLVERKLVMYHAVETEPWAQAATRAIYADLLEEHPYLLGHSWPQVTRYGHCVRRLLEHPDVQGGRVRADYVSFGVPCQPFSTARARAPGLRDRRECFTVTHKLFQAFLRNPANAGMKMAVECVCFGIPTHSPHLQDDLAKIDSMFAEVGMRRMQLPLHGRWTAARRNRFLWTNYTLEPLPEVQDRFTFAAVLENGWKPAEVRQLHGKVDPYAATLMASAHSEIRKRGLNDLVSPTGERVPCPLEVEERIMGLQPGDTDVEIRGTRIPHDRRVRLIGNGIPVELHAFLLRRALAHLELALFAPDEETGNRNANEEVNLIGDLVSPAFEQQFRQAALADTAYQTLLGQARANPIATGLSILENRLYDREGRCLVPQDLELRQKIIQQLHEDPPAGHGGIGQTIRRIEDYYSWPGLRQHVAEFVRTCPGCQQNKQNQVRRTGNIFPLSASYPGEALSMDFFEAEPYQGVGSTGRTISVNKIWIIVDQFSKYCRLIPMESTTGSVTAERLVDIYMQQCMPIFGVPRSITSDNDPLFRAHFWSAFLSRLGVRQNLITAYRPQGNGQAENSVKKALAVLRSMLNVESAERPADWLKALPIVELVVNTSLHSVTGFTPAELHFGRRFVLPYSFALPPNGLTNLAETATDIMEQVRANTQLARQRLQKARADIQARREAAGGTDARRIFQPGQEVMVAAKGMTGPYRARGRKLEPVNMGPYVVLERLRNGDGQWMDTYSVKERGQPDTASFRMNADRMLLHRRSNEDLFRLPRQQPLRADAHLARFQWNGLKVRRNWEHGNMLPPHYEVSRAHGRSLQAVVRAEVDVHSHPLIGPRIEDAGNAGPWTLALQALRAYEDQVGQIEDLHYPGEDEPRWHLCDAHRFLLHNLPSTDAVPQYEVDENNNLRLQEHWRLALRDLRH